jgi:hypothetical protein
MLFHDLGHTLGRGEACGHLVYFDQCEIAQQNIGCLLAHLACCQRIGDQLVRGAVYIHSVLSFSCH